MLVLSRRPDESITFPGLGITVHLLQLNSKVARVGIEAPKSVRVLRKELADGTAEETIDIDSFLAAAASREQLHDLRNQLNGINLGLQLYRCQIDAGMAEEGAKTFQRVIEQLRLMEQNISKQSELAKPANKAKDVEESRRPIKILLVEDDRSQLDMLAGILTLRGFDVATASSGKEAMEYVTHHRAPDFVLMDMRMPEGDGPSAIRDLRTVYAEQEMKILAISGSEPRDVGDVSGFDRWFAKPVNTETLVQYMNQSVGSLSVAN